MSKKWTNEELKIIQNSNGEVPSIEGRTRSAIKEKMSDLGLLKQKNRPWTPEEIKLVMDGATYIKGRTSFAIHHALRRIKVAKRQKDSQSYSKNIWNQNNTDTLKDLIEHGYDFEDIHEMNIFNVSKNAIRKKINRMGLNKKYETIRLNGEVLDLFKKFLVDHWQQKTPRDLMQKWNKENASHIVNLKTIVYYLAVLNINIPYTEIQKIYELREKEKHLNISNKDSPNQLSERIRLERIKLMRERAEKRIDIWTGLPIPKEFESLTNRNSDIWQESI